MPDHYRTRLPKLTDSNYERMSQHKLPAVYYPNRVPLDFIKDEDNIGLRFISVNNKKGIIFYRPEAFFEAYQIFLSVDYHKEKRSSVLEEKGEPEDLLVETKPLPNLIPIKELVTPHGINPHDGLEYALMHSGQKKVAYFYCEVPCEFILNPFCLTLHHFATHDDCGMIYYMAGAEEKAEKLFNLLSNIKCEQDTESHRLIGRLLGYRPSDIEVFLKFIA